QQGQRTVHGFIDRLLISDDKIIIVDYKTHQVQSDAEQDKLCAFYQPQLALYRRGLTKAWPDKSVESYILFTHKVNVKRVN
ncbi:PD-(D/E)XK nuclease family protein, partial [Kaarinaea lacus]